MSVAAWTSIRREPDAPVRAVPSRADETLRGVFVAALGARPLRVLDAGCGTGASTLLLWDLGHYPHGVDADADAVHRARSTARSRCAAVPFSVGDAQDLDFPAAVFDAVHAGDVLDGLARPEWALAEWFRVLRRGGVLVVTASGRGDSAGRGASALADRLRRAGFADVGFRASPRSSEPSCRAARWYRRIVARRRSCWAAWGRRP